MPSISRIGWALVIMLVSALASTVPVTAQSPSPDPDASPAFDLITTMPTHIGTVELALEAYGPEEMAARLQESEDVLMSTLRAVLAESDGAPMALSMATASPADAEAAERYRLVAMRAPGIEAMALVSGMFRHLLTEQIRASGIEDPEQIERMAQGFESMVPWQTVAGREVASPNSAADTTFELLYPYGEILFMVQAADGASMEEVLAALP